MPDPVILSVPVSRLLLDALTVRARELDCSVEELVAAVVGEYVMPQPQLDLERLGQAMLDALEISQSIPVEPVHVTEEQLAEIKKFLLPEDAVALALGEALMAHLVGPLVMPQADARRAAVTEMTQLLMATFTEAEVRRWWTQSRSQLGGVTPLDRLGEGWTPDDATFQAVRALAEADLGSAAT